MGLKIKSFTDSMKSMVDWVAQNTSRLVDFSVGSAIRTLLEAVATEVEEFYYRTYKNFIWAQENSIYQSFDFEKRPAMPAYGMLTLSFIGPLNTDYILNPGTRFSTFASNPSDVVYFETRDTYLFPAGSTSANIKVYCTTPGEVGNVGSNTITQMVNVISFVSVVSNPERFNTGREEEAPRERKQRFSKYVDTRHRGTKKALEYGALEVEEVTGVYVDDTLTGIVYLYAHDANGDLSDDLKRKIEKNLENYRSAGIPVFVQPILKTELDVEVDVYVFPNFNNDSFRLYVAHEIEKFLDDYTVGRDFFRSDLNAFIRGLDEISIKNVVIKNHQTDKTISNNELIRSGTVTVHLVSV